MLNVIPCPSCNGEQTHYPGCLTCRGVCQVYALTCLPFIPNNYGSDEGARSRIKRDARIYLLEKEKKLLRMGA